MVVRLKWRFVPLIMLFLAIVEIVVFVLVAQAIGAGWALLALLAFSAAGMVMLAREGRRGWARVREATRGGTPVGTQAADGIAGAAGALLLFLPGFLTGVVGAIVLIPPIRNFVAARIRVATEKRVSSSTAGNLFGPRRVRAERTPSGWPGPPAGGVASGAPTAAGSAGGAAAGSATATGSGSRPASGSSDEVIEGEIVD